MNGHGSGSTAQKIGEKYGKSGRIRKSRNTERKYLEKNIEPVVTEACASLIKVRFMVQGTKAYSNLFCILLSNNENLVITIQTNFIAFLLSSHSFHS